MINTLSLILIISGLLNFGEEISLHCQILMDFLRKLLTTNLTQHEYITLALSKMGILFKMACFLASSRQPSNCSSMQSSKLSKLLKLLDLLSRKFPALNTIDASVCLKMYSWDALFSAGSKAGFGLRSAWDAWHDGSSASFAKTNSAPLTITGDVS